MCVCGRVCVSILSVNAHCSIGDVRISTQVHIHEMPSVTHVNHAAQMYRRGQRRGKMPRSGNELAPIMQHYIKQYNCTTLYCTMLCYTILYYNHTYNILYYNTGAAGQLTGRAGTELLPAAAEMASPACAATSLPITVDYSIL